MAGDFSITQQTVVFFQISKSYMAKSTLVLIFVYDVVELFSTPPLGCDDETMKLKATPGFIVCLGGVAIWSPLNANTNSHYSCANTVYDTTVS